MRTTLVIPEPVCRRAKAVARRQGKTLSGLVTEALSARLAREENQVREVPATYRVTPAAMGKPAVDVSDRNALFQAMEGGA
jgi:hypothetical protein